MTPHKQKAEEIVEECVECDSDTSYGFALTCDDKYLITKIESALNEAFEAGQKSVLARMPDDKTASKELWSRVHRRETKEEYKLPQNIVREITADAYWMACFNWLKQKLEGDKK